MDAKTRRFVRDRADHRCEYCRMPQAAIRHSFHLEHIVARQHVVDDSLANLALACDRCNFYKGTNISTIDPETGQLVTLFHPRSQSWSEHFALLGARIIGLTAIGRATVRLLNMNAARRLELRAVLLKTGKFYQGTSRDNE